MTLLIPAGAFGSVFPDSDSKSVPIGPELLFQVCHFYILWQTHMKIHIGTVKYFVT